MLRRWDNEDTVTNQITRKGREQGVGGRTVVLQGQARELGLLSFLWPGSTERHHLSPLKDCTGGTEDVVSPAIS